MKAVSWSKYLHCYRTLSVQKPQTANILTNPTSTEPLGQGELVKSTTVD